MWLCLHICLLAVSVTAAAPSLQQGPSVRARNCFMTLGHLTQVHCHRLLLSFSQGTIFLALWEGASIKLRKIAKRINRLPGRQQRRKLGKVDQLYLCVTGGLVNGVQCAKCASVSYTLGEGERAQHKAGEKRRHAVWWATSQLLIGSFGVMPLRHFTSQQILCPPLKL